MPKSKTLKTQRGQIVHLLHEGEFSSLFEILKNNRHIEDEGVFFSPSLSDLHDPFLLPDMTQAVDQILRAREQKERIVVFGDYDVDGVSSTALLVRYLYSIGCDVSYRLPHRVHDGYGLKTYHFDELSKKGVKLVITVDCGTRDREVIEYAKTLGINVIVTDHHAVPDAIPEGVPLINPKRKDSIYPFRDLAGAGVAFKLVHGITEEMRNIGLRHREGNVAIQKNQEEWIASCLAMTEKSYQEKILKNSIDLASLGTVSDCMPITGENRTIVSLGLHQIRESKSGALRKYMTSHDTRAHTLDADIIGFQIGPRINAAGRMDTPMTALQWLLASEEKVDGFFEELEHLNEQRKGMTEAYFEKALKAVDFDAPILIYDADDLEHGVMGLVAAKLVEMSDKPAIVIKHGHDHPLTRHKGDEVDPTIQEPDESLTPGDSLSIASCRSPEWCNLIELLDGVKDVFTRYGGHRQAAGFTLLTEKVGELKNRLKTEIAKHHDITNLPKRAISVECCLPPSELTLENLDVIDRFRPYGIGNPKPLFLLEEMTITECRVIGSEGDHLSLRFAEKPDVKLLYWKGAKHIPLLEVGNIISLIIELDRNEWNGKMNIQGVVIEIISE